MRQVVHLLIVDSERFAAAGACYGPRWLLPIVQCEERVRTDPLVARWAAEHGVGGDLVGHWLGRLDPGSDAIDWLVVIKAAPSAALDPALAWIPLDTLATTSSVVDYQTWAARKTLENGSVPQVGGPFGNVTWLEDVRTWIATVVSSEPGRITPYRTGAHEVVLGVETARGRMYFKGLGADRAGEATLTAALAALIPAAFARTIALEHRPDGTAWWLAAECPGAPGGNAHTVARSLARLQQRLMSAGRVLDHVPRLELAAMLAWADALLEDPRAIALLRESCEWVTGVGLPHSWIPLDLDPSNVLVDERGAVRFIDIDDSFFGPAPLAMAVFAQRCGRAGGNAGAESPGLRSRSIYASYEYSWSPALEGIAWRAVETVAALVEASLGWRRLQRNTDRGEVHRVLVVARPVLRDRLLNAIYRR